MKLLGISSRGIQRIAQTLFYEEGEEALYQEMRDYLTSQGKKSIQEICDDLDVNETDVSMAVQDGFIVPVHSVSGPGAWYMAAD